MTESDRLRDERRFHDAQAAERAASFAAGGLRFDDADYLDHESWVRPAFETLEPLAGADALDYGCGHGMAAVVLARRGARVTAFDLSPGYVAETRRRAEANGVAVRALAANGEELPFADGSFDRVWGHAVLHHLDPARAGPELRRVLRPGGVAVFCEPWGGNPLLALARARLPYPGKHRTPDERPLTRRDVAALRGAFPDLTVAGHQLFSMLRRALPAPLRPAAAPLAALDRALLRAAPGLGAWCRYAVLTLRRR